MANPVDEFLRANITRNVPLAELAASAFLSPSHFARQFKRRTGLAPHQYQIRLRVSLAREQVLSGRYSLAAIAQQTGFADHSHMTRQFQDVLGVTPGELVKTARTIQTSVVLF